MTDAPDTRPESPAPSPRERLERAAAGLVYSSEGDVPFTFVELAPADVVGSAPLTAAVVARLAGAPAGARIEERSLDAFLARHRTRVDPADVQSQALRPRYDALAAELRATLRDLRVVRVGVPGQAEVRCFLVGYDARGAVSGLATSAIET